MAPAAQAYAAYRNADISTLSHRDLLIKLYEGAIRFINQGQVAIRNKRYEPAHQSCSKAKRIFMELLATLNFERGGPIAIQLRDIYLFIITQIVEANLRKNADQLQALLPIIDTLLDAWRKVPDQHANTSSIDENRNSGLDLVT